MWWPERPRLWRREKGSGDGWGLDGLDFGGIEDAFVGIAIFLAVVAVIVLLFTVVLPLVVLGLEVLIVLVLACAGIAGRMLFGEPWTVRARGGGGRELSWRVRGFGASGRLRDDVAQALANGDRDPRPAGALT